MKELITLEYAFFDVIQFLFETFFTTINNIEKIKILI